MKIRTGEIADKDKDKKIVSSVKLSKGTRVGTLKLTVNGEEQDSVPVRGLGGGSSTVIGGSVDTQALWDAINKKVDVDFFKNLFTVYDSSDIEIATNTYTRKPDNLKISVGTWTEEYLSALGKNSEGGSGGGIGTVIGIALGTGTTPIYPDDDTGIVTLPAYPTKVSQLVNDSGFVTSSTLNNYVTSSYLANNFYTKAQADSKYMTIAAFESLFNALDSNGDKINHPYSSGVDSIKALVGLWTEQYLSALGQNSEGGSSGGGSVNAIKVGTNPDTYLDPVEGIIDMSNYVTTAAQRTLWTNSAHTHSNKAVLDNITAGQVTAWNNVAAIMGEDQDNIINKWNEVVAFLATYTEADTLANLLSNKLDVEFFRKIFTVYDEDGNIIVPNTYTQVADNLKILVGTWTEEYLSALGKNSEGGSGGTGDVSHIKISSNPDVYLDPVEGIIDMSSYAATWNNKQNAISDLATIRSNASNGNTAYSWGNHANAGYAQASNTVSNVAYNTTGKKLTKTINGNTTDIVSASTLVTDGGGAKASTTITAGNGLTGGGDLSSNRTINVVSANAAITVNADNIKLNVINDYTTTTNNTIIPLAAARGKDLNDRLAILESWFEVDSNGNIKTKDMPNGTHRGFYTESFVSALGANSEGGGSSTFDEEQMWTALQSTSGTYATTKIATSHIPDMASTYGYLKSSALSGYATQSWVNQQGFLTTHQTLYTLSIYGGTTKVLDFKPNADASIYIKAGGDISLTNDTTNKYITLSYTHPTNGANTTISAANGKVLSAITVNSLGHVTSVSSKTLAAADIPDISATYATASRATTLEGYFNSDGVAKTAAKLNTGTTTYTAWGQTYWSSGVPQSISGNMTSVGSITPSANGNALGTTSARFAIYGTSGNFSGNVSIGGTLGVTGATTLTGLLTANGGIVVPSAKTIKIGDCTISWDSTNSMLKFDTGIYSTGAVSALGSNSSGGGSGTFDEEAMWTALGTTSTAKVIASSHIPNLDASKITSGTFAAARIPDLSSKYLPLTGGTLQRSSGDTPLYIKTNNASGAYIGYKLNDDTTMGFIGVHATHGAAYVNNGTVYPILRSDNYSSYALPLSGGTITLSSINGLTINKSNNAAGMIRFTNGSTLLGYLGYYGIENPACNVGGTYYSLVHEGNYDSIIGNSYIRRKTYGLDGGKAVRITFNNVNGGIINVRSTLSGASLILVGNGYGEGGTTRNNWVQLSHTTSSFSWCIPTASGIEKSVEIYNNTSISASVVVASFDTGVTFTELSALSTTASTVKVAYASDYLPLSGGTLTGSLKVATGYGISDATGNGLLVYKPATTWGGISSTQWGVGADVQGVIRSGGRTNLLHYDATAAASYVILDTNNTNVVDGVGYINGNAITTVNVGERNTYIFNGGGYDSSSSVTVNDLAASCGSAVGMIYANTDNPMGKTGWFHVWSQTWAKGVITSWVSQIAIGTANKTGMYYRATNNTETIVGKEWTRVLDSSNYNSYSPSLTGAGASGTWGISITGSISGFSAINLCREHVYATATNLDANDLTNNLTLYRNSSDMNQWGSATFTNFPSSRPSGGFSMFVVTESNGYTRQFYSYYNNPALYVRYRYYSGGVVWSSWYKMYNSGNANLSTVDWACKNLTAAGEVTASSDERKKNIISNTKFNVKDIASARSIIYEWNDDRDKDNEKKIHGGSIAQDWLGKADSFLSQDNDGWYSINYGALALCSAITIARMTINHEDRITILEKENAKLKARVAELEERRAL